MESPNQQQGQKKEIVAIRNLPANHLDLALAAPQQLENLPIMRLAADVIETIDRLFTIPNHTKLFGGFSSDSAEARQSCFSKVTALHNALLANKKSLDFLLNPDIKHSANQVILECGSVLGVLRAGDFIGDWSIGSDGAVSNSNSAFLGRLKSAATILIHDLAL